MSKHIQIGAFRNTFAILFNLDLHELESAGVIEPNAKGGSDWSRFNDDIGMFVLKLEDDKLRKLYELVQSRQPEKYKDAPFDDLEEVTQLAMNAADEAKHG